MASLSSVDLFSIKVRPAASTTNTENFTSSEYSPLPPRGAVVVRRHYTLARSALRGSLAITLSSRDWLRVMCQTSFTTVSSTFPIPAIILVLRSAYYPLLQDKRLSVQGELIRGLNNGDDAIIVTENFLGVDDGLTRGILRLWSRLLLHFWALEIERRICTDTTTLEPIEYLQSAYEATIQATSGPTEWYGTTTSATAILHWRCGQDGAKKPLLYVTNLGDCKVLVIRPSEEKILFRTKEQWHWFDCPMQLGTNSVDTPRNDAVMNEVDIQEEDIVLALSDGVMDNLWEHEVLKIIMDSLEKYDAGKANWKSSETPPDLSNDRMVYAAKELLNAALTIAQDPFAESPFMEKGMEEGLPIEGGKLISCQSVFSGRETDCIGTGKMDDISVIVGACKRRDG
ncbi:hypothetical protein N7470_001999 [Penicillium chermesinum]|nr:hypothetical protein N7470_001999 [Penicillium chermesinum]